VTPLKGSKNNAMRIGSILKFLAFIGLLTLLSGIGVWFFWGQIVEYDLPKAPLKIEKLRPTSSVEILDSQNRVIEYITGEQHQIFRPLNQISKNLQTFVVMAEDAKFFTHNGFDIQEIKNAFEKNRQSGEIKRGASTITQQLVKNLFLDSKKNYLRKLFEVPWALRVEKDLSKNQILELYLNIIEWGPGIYGAEAAARHYFDSTAAALGPIQAIYLTMIVPNPKRFDLFQNPTRREFLINKKNTFVERLFAEKQITLAEKQHWLESDFHLSEPNDPSRTFASFHRGNYPGNFKTRSPLQTYLRQNIKEISKTSGRSLQLRTKLDILLQQQFDSIQLNASDEAIEERYGILYENGDMRAFRKISANLELNKAQLQQLTETEYGAEVFQNYEYIEKKSFSVTEIL
jgi:monofunctional biosynthetic peptidoglycan transglycosylase